jgi:hypothetical protein
MNHTASKIPLMGEWTRITSTPCNTQVQTKLHRWQW